MAGDLTRASLPFVLVVDDDAMVLSALGELLGDSYTVLTAMNYEDATQSFVEHIRDIRAVILDVRMKKRDGFSVCAEIRRYSPTVPVIFYSAYQNVKDATEIINAYHPFGYLRKGDDSAQLVDAVARAVRFYEFTAEQRELLSGMSSVSSKMNRIKERKP